MGRNKSLKSKKESPRKAIMLAEEFAAYVNGPVLNVRTTTHIHHGITYRLDNLQTTANELVDILLLVDRKVKKDPFLASMYLMKGFDCLDIFEFNYFEMYKDTYFTKHKWEVIAKKIIKLRDAMIEWSRYLSERKSKFRKRAKENGKSIPEGTIYDFDNSIMRLEFIKRYENYNLQAYY